MFEYKKYLKFFFFYFVHCTLQVLETVFEGRPCSPSHVQPLENLPFKTLCNELGLQVVVRLFSFGFLLLTDASQDFAHGSVDGLFAVPKRTLEPAAHLRAALGGLRNQTLSLQLLVGDDALTNVFLHALEKVIVLLRSFVLCSHLLVLCVLVHTAYVLVRVSYKNEVEQLVVHLVLPFTYT